MMGRKPADNNRYHAILPLVVRQVSKSLGIIRIMNFNFLKNWQKKDLSEKLKPIKTTKSNTHLFFKSIRDFENKVVKDIVTSSEEFLHITRPDLPKKDSGQTGLIVAYKVANFEIANYLVEKGADVNFHQNNRPDDFTMPALHHCIMATIFQCNTMQKKNINFLTAIESLKLILNKNADPNSIDSHGNSCLMRAFLDSKQMIDHPNFSVENRTLDELRGVFEVLISKGASIEYFNDKREKLEKQIIRTGYEKYNLI